jgi:hypothetical protein
MANIKRVYQRDAAGRSETVTIMAYIGAATGDSDEIRRIIERDSTVVEDKIAYFGTAGTKWLDEQHSTYVAYDFHLIADGAY